MILKDTTITINKHLCTYLLTPIENLRPLRIPPSEIEILNQLTLIYMFAWINRVTFV